AGALSPLEFPSHLASAPPHRSGDRLPPRPGLLLRLARSAPRSDSRAVPCLSRATWVEQDSNLRRQCHQIYSLAPLAAWVSTRLGLLPRVGRRTSTSRRGQTMRRSAPCSRRRAGGETRTHNLRFTKPLLCQLSYASNQGRETTYYIVLLNECKRFPGPIGRTPIVATMSC